MIEVLIPLSFLYRLECLVVIHLLYFTLVRFVAPFWHIFVNTLQTLQIDLLFNLTSETVFCNSNIYYPVNHDNRIPQSKPVNATCLKFVLSTNITLQINITSLQNNVLT